MNLELRKFAKFVDKTFIECDVGVNAAHIEIGRAHV